MSEKKRIQARLKVVCDRVNASNDASTRLAGKTVKERENKTVKLSEAAKKAVKELKKRR